MNKQVPHMIDLAIRMIVLILTLTVGVVILFVGAARAHAAEPRGLIMVSGDTLRAGDVFTGLNPDQAEYVLGTPPQPGKDMVLDAHILSRIASAIQLDWRPKSPAEKAVVRRAATIVTADNIRESLDKELRAHGVDGKFNVALSDLNAQLVLPQSAPQTLAVKTLRFNPENNWFEALLVAPSKENPVVEMPVTGKVQHLVPVPVLRNTLRSGDLIGMSDISLLDMPEDDVQAGMLLKADKLVNMTPDRIIYAGKPVRDSEVRRPQVVARNDFITLIYKSGPMMLTVKGKAMQDGAAGDLVRVVNVASSRSLQGIATGDHEVTVTE